WGAGGTGRAESGPGTAARGPTTRSPGQERCVGVRDRSRRDRGVRRGRRPGQEGAMSDVIRLAVVIGLLLCAMLGWAGGHVGGAFVGLLIGLMALVLPWRGQPLWRWAGHYARRNRPIALQEPVTVTNDRSG